MPSGPVAPLLVLAAERDLLEQPRGGVDRGVSDATAPGTATPYGSSKPDTPRLVPFARGVYHVRNRAMLPAGGSPSQIGQPSMGQPILGTWILMQQGLSSGAAVHGRFMQPDPNATAMAVLNDISYHGRAVGSGVDQFSLEGRLANGASLYQYLGGNPLQGSDPLGLYDLEDGYDWEDGYEDFNDLLGLLDPLPGPSDFIRGMLSALVSQYAEHLDYDADWASDWSFDDDGHSRLDNTWVYLALGQGLRDAFDIDLPFSDQSINPTDWFEAGAYAGRRTRGGSPFRQRLPRTLVSAKNVRIDSSLPAWHFRVDTNVSPGEGNVHIHVFKQERGRAPKEVGKIDGFGKWMRQHGGGTPLLRPSQVPGVVRFEANKLIRWTQQQLRAVGRFPTPLSERRGQ